MKVIIIKIHRATADKSGRPYVTQDGRPYTRLGLQTKEHGVNWLSGFGNNYNQNWKEGDQVEIEITQVEKEGKHYLNFRSLGKLELLEKRIVELEKKVSIMWTPGKVISDNNDIPIFDPKDEEEPNLDNNMPL